MNESADIQKEIKKEKEKKKSNQTQTTGITGVIESSRGWVGVGADCSTRLQPSANVLSRSQPLVEIRDGWK